MIKIFINDGPAIGRTFSIDEKYIINNEVMYFSQRPYVKCKYRVENNIAYFISHY